MPNYMRKVDLLLDKQRAAIEAQDWGAVSAASSLMFRLREELITSVTTQGNLEALLALQRMGAGLKHHHDLLVLARGGEHYGLHTG